MKDGEKETLLKRIGQLENDLRRYGSHEDDCGWNETGECTCGFSNYIKVQEPKDAISNRKITTKKVVKKVPKPNKAVISPKKFEKTAFMYHLDGCNWYQKEGVCDCGYSEIIAKKHFSNEDNNHKEYYKYF